MLEKTLLILTSDHGEQFGEHGNYGHGLQPLRAGGPCSAADRLPGTHSRGRVVDRGREPARRAGDRARSRRLTSDSPFPGTSLATTWRHQPDQSAGPSRTTIRAGCPDRGRPRPARYKGIRWADPRSLSMEMSTSGMGAAPRSCITSTPTRASHTTSAARENPVPCWSTAGTFWISSFRPGDSRLRPRERQPALEMR